MDTSSMYRQATLLGLMRGMRSTSGLATVSEYLNRSSPSQALDAPWDRLGSPTAATLLKVALLGEIAADKTPWIPKRISPMPLVGRTLMSAIASGTFARSHGEAALTGALLGGLVAVASNFATYYLRQQIDQRLHIPDLITALAEDAVVLTLALNWLKTTEAAA